MTVAFDAVGPSSSGSYTASVATGASATWTHVLGASANAITVSVAVGNSSTATTTIVVKVGSTTMTALGKALSDNTTNSGYVQLFGLISPPTGSQTITVTLTGTTSSIAGGSVSFTGAGSFGTAATNYGYTAAPTVSITPTASGNMITAGWCSGSTGTITAGTGDTLRWSHSGNNNSGAGNGGQETYPTVGTAAVNMTAAVPKDYWGIVAAEVQAGSTSTTYTGAVALAGTSSLLAVPPAPILEWKEDSSQADVVAAGYENDSYNRETAAGSDGASGLAWPILLTAAPGGRAGRAVPFVVPAGAHRYEIVAATNYAMPGDTWFYGLASYLGAGFPTGGATFQVITQLRQSSDTGSPVACLEVRNGQIRLSGGYQVDGASPASQYQYDLLVLDNVQLTTWYNIVFRVSNFSEAVGQSTIDVWINGVQCITSFTIPCATVYPDTTGDVGTAWKHGIYHDTSLGATTIYHTAAAQGTTYAAVDPTPPVTTYTGAVALSGTSTLTTSGTRVQPGAVALGGTSSLTETVNQTQHATVALAGASSLSATAGTSSSFAALHDDFTATSSEWTDSGAGVSNGSAYINVAGSGGTPTYASKRSRQVYSWPGSPVVFGDVIMPGVAGDTANAQLWVNDPNPAATVDRLGFEYAAATNTLTLRGQTGSGYAAIGTDVTLTYDPVAHRWLSIADTGSSIVWSTSADGLTWTTQRTYSTPPAWTTKTTLQIDLEGFRSSGTNDTMRVGSINVAQTPLATSTPSPVDALQSRTLTEVRTWESWLSANSARGWVGEFGWVTLATHYSDPTQGAQWAALGDIYETELDVAGLSGTTWASGQEWGNGYPLGVHVGVNVGDPLTIANTDAAGVVATHRTRGGRWRGVSLAGYEHGIATSGGGTVRSSAGYVHTAADFMFLAGQGVDTVRLPVAWERLQPTLSTALDTTGLSALDGMLTAARQAGVRVVIDLHNYGYYTDASNVAHALGDATLTQAAFVDFWTRLSAWVSATATRSGTVIGYGLMNEPHDLPGGTATWTNAAQAVLTAIRAGSDTRLVLVAGYAWSSLTNWPTTHPSGFITDTATNFVYEAHHYWDTASVQGSRTGTYQQSNGSGGQQIETYATELAAASATTYVGAATLGGTSSLVAGATRVQPGAVVLGGTSTLTTSGTGTTYGSVPLAGSSSLSAGSTRVQPATATLAGTSGLVAGAFDIMSGAVPMSGAGSLTASGTGATFGTVALGATSSLTASSTRVQPGAVALSGTSTLGTTGTGTTFGTVALSGTSALAAGAFATTFGSVVLAGSSSLTASSTRVQLGSVGLTGASTLGAGAIDIASGIVTLFGDGALNPTSTMIAASAATLSASGGLNVGVTGVAVATVSWGGLGTLSAGAAATEQVAAVFGASAALSVLGTVIEYGAVNLSADAELGVAGIVTGFGGLVGLSGTADLSAAAVVTGFAALGLSAGAGLSVGAIGVAVAAVSLDAEGVLELGVDGATFGAVTLASVTDLALGVTTTHVGSLNLAGDAALVAASEGEAVAGLLLGAGGVLVAGASITTGSSVALDAAGALGVSVLRTTSAALVLGVTGTLSASAIVSTTLGLVLTGGSGLALGAGTTRFAGLVLSADAVLATSAFTTGASSAAVALAALSTLDAATARTAAAIVTLAGSSDLATAASMAEAVAVVLSAAASLVATATHSGPGGPTTPLAPSAPGVVVAVLGVLAGHGSASPVTTTGAVVPQTLGATAPTVETY
jgi:hypothetical protein